MKVSVVVTTYNRPDALDAVLAGYCSQDLCAFEMLVADDGSSDCLRDMRADSVIAAISDLIDKRGIPASTAA